MSASEKGSQNGDGSGDEDSETESIDVNEKIGAIEAELSNSKSLLGSIANTKPIVELLLTIIRQQQREKKQLFEKIETLTQAVEGLKAQPKQGDDSAEEKERRRSIVIMGVEESNGASEREKFKQDKVKVERLLDAMDVGCEPAQVYRLGKPNADPAKSRLIKVVLPTSFFQSQCLVKSRRLREFDGLKNIYIRPSLTKEQRDADYMLRQELRQRNTDKNGKYVRRFQINRGKIVSVRNTENH